MNLFDRSLDKIGANKKSQFGVFFILLLGLTCIMMYCYQPICPGHDFFFHYRRLQSLMDALNSSPLLIYLDYSAVDGYGYFTKISYPDFALIPFAAIGNLTNIEFAYKSIIFTYTILCGVLTYWAVNRVYKNAVVASTSAILYTFCLYRLFDIYHRSALGEAITFTFIPIIFLGLYEIIAGDYKKWYLLTIGYSLFILTHILSPILMFITMMIFLIIYYKRLIKEPKRISYLFLAGAATLPIIAYYVYPVLEQTFSTTFLYQRDQLLSNAQDASLKANWIIWGLFNGIIQPRQIAIPATGLLLTCAITLRLFVYEKSSKLRSTDILTIVGLCYIFACSSFFPWSVFPFNKLNFIQLPWRLYEFVSFLFAVAGAYYLSLLLKTNRRIAYGMFALAVATTFVLVSDGNLYKEIRCQNDIYHEATLSNSFHLSGVGFVSAKVPSIEYIAARGSDSISTKYADTNISNFGRDNGITSFDIELKNAELLELPLFYYKGYDAELNGEKIPVHESNNGLVQINTNESGHVKIYYGGTIIQKISYYISIISILTLCFYIFVQRRKEKLISKKNNNATH